jgi:uncharacterized coiled-coil protein SlyX
LRTADLNVYTIRALRREKPTTVMGMIRAVWPDIRAALEHGHTLRVIHARLVESGIPVEYRQLSVYLRRLERKQRRVVTKSAASPTVESPPPHNHARDPLSNIRERTRKSTGFQFEQKPADESELI